MAPLPCILLINIISIFIFILVKRLKDAMVEEKCIIHAYSDKKIKTHTKNSFTITFAEF